MNGHWWPVNQSLFPRSYLRQRAPALTVSDVKTLVLGKF